MWECRGKHPQAQFSVRSGTFIEDSRIGLGQWLTTLWLIAERDQKISSYEVARRVGITQKSAWLRMMKRIRRAIDLSRVYLAKDFVAAPSRTNSGTKYLFAGADAELRGAVIRRLEVYRAAGNSSAVSPAARDIG